MKTLLIAAVCAVALSACQTPSGTSTSWCETHSVNDYRRTAEERALETPAERRQRLNDLTYGEKTCGWKP